MAISLATGSLRQNMVNHRKVRPHSWHGHLARGIGDMGWKPVPLTGRGINQFIPTQALTLHNGFIRAG
jgi:hypothetical protein